MLKQTLIKIMVLVFVVLPAGSAFCYTFKVATYNVENLFDAHRDGTEYPDYIPGGKHGWNQEMAVVKATNIARVILALEAGIVCLQEVENRAALDLLLKKLRRGGLDYPYSAIAETPDTAVSSAVISRHPIIEKQTISPGRNRRDILKVTVNVHDRPLIIFVNHWKSRRAPESERLVYAEALKKAVRRLEPNSDYILAGDFNSDYNEYRTFRDTPRNDTDGVTGINHVLRTKKSGRMVSEAVLIDRPTERYHYNLWLELPARQRWSHNFFGRYSTLDSLILSPGLYDDQGIAYVDNSFDRFTADFLFENGSLFRWQRADRGRGRHLGEGYSDHLPLYALFTTRPFTPAPDRPRNGREEAGQRAVHQIADLYRARTGPVDMALKDCAVIYRHDDSAVIRQGREGRPIYVYRAAGKLIPGGVYDLTVKQLYDFHGLREITAIDDLTRKQGAVDPADFFLSVDDIDLNDGKYQNEVIAEVSGRFKDDTLYYGHGHQIRVYFKDESLKPENNTRVSLSGVRVGHYRTPQLVIEKAEQIRVRPESGRSGRNSGKSP